MLFQDELDEEESGVPPKGLTVLNCEMVITDYHTSLTCLPL